MASHLQPTTAHPDPQREPVLDGIRGIAILIVLFHHLVYSSGIDRGFWFDLQFFRLGYSSWVGVDLFFVLSGFLITGILYEAKGSERYFSSFYGRRVLRIFPLYYGFLLFAVLLFPHWLPPESAQNLQQNQHWYWLYLSNFYVALEGWQDPTHLGHFWSLAIEEQFYLLWPMAVWALDRRALMRLAVACFVGALVIRLALVLADVSTLVAYVMLPTRMDSLAAGAFLALCIRGPGGTSVLERWPRWVLSGSAVVVVGLYLREGRLDFEDPLVTIVGYTAIATAGASLIAVALTAQSHGWIRRGLSAIPLTLLGRYSYGLYVYHVPIILFLESAGLRATLFPRLMGSTLPGVAVFCAVGGFLSLAVAVASYHLWEAQFLRLKRHFPYGEAVREPAAMTRAVP
jgi:peptidoglycan/LPS O-acetylase OafA/YrhL